MLTPGAGANRDQHTLVAIEQGLAPLPCSRVDFPYRIAGKRAPDGAPVAIEHLVREAAALVAKTGAVPDQLVLGGRSYGGRMCSMAVAEGLPAAGLVLFISGDKDPFGSPAEFAEHVAATPGPVTQVWLPGGHDPRNADQKITETVTTWLTTI